MSIKSIRGLVGVTEAVLLCFLAVFWFAPVPVSAAGDLTDVTDTLSDHTAGAAAAHTVSFTTNSQMPGYGEIIITFPAGFNISEVELGSNTQQFYISYHSGRDVKIRLKDDHDVIPANTTLSFRLDNIVNTTIPGSGYHVSVKTVVFYYIIIDGPTASADFSISEPQLVITTASPLPDGTVGSVYSQILAASGGAAPYTSWAVTSGALPGGLSLNAASGEISGIPATAIGPAAITFEVTDSASHTATKSLDISIAKGTPSFSNLSHPTINVEVTPTTISGKISLGTLYPGGIVTITIDGVSQDTAISGTDGSFSSDFATGELAAGSYPITYQYAGDSNFNSQIDTGNSLTVNPASLMITTASPLPDGTVGSVYSQTLAASGGVTPYTNWAVTSGALPGGLSLNAASGEISGIPATAIGPAAITFEVTDSASHTATKSLDITIAKGTPSFSNLSHPTINAGGTPTAIGGKISLGSLYPSGNVNITINSVSHTAAISGTDGSFSYNFVTGELAAGSYPITYQYAGNSNFNSQINTGNSLTVSPASLTITTGSPLTAGTVGISYSASFNASGGTGPYIWALNTGSTLPNGITLSGNTISGTPTTAGSYSFTLKVTDNAAASVTRAYSLTIAKGTPSFSNLSHPTINAGVTPTAIGGKISLGSLYPSGDVIITINSVSHTAAISGTDGSFSYNFVTGELAAGSYPITYQYAGNSNFNSQINTGNSLTVSPASLTITTGSPLTAGTVGISYSASFNASGGTGPYIWALNTGSTLPNGITLSGNTISGTPTTAGSYSFTLKVTDNAAASVTRAYSLTIAKGTPSFSNLSHPTINAGGTPTAIGGKISLGSLYPSGNVNITINSVSHTAAISGTDGSFSYNFVTGELAAGSYPITYQYAGNSNFNSQINTGNSLTVSPASLTITTGSPLTAGTVGISYSASFNASGGTAPYIWALNTGSTLPNGITLSGNTISGTPTAAGSYSFTMKVTDNAAASVTRAYSLTIAKGTPSFSNLSHPTINAGVTPTTVSGKISLGSLYPSGNVNITINSVSHTAAISASDGSFSYNFVTGELAAGSYPITYQYAGNSNFNSQINTGNSLTVSPASLTITTGSPLTAGTVGISYSASFNASGGTAPYIWALNTGSTLPNGITLSGNTISGTPTTAGSYSFTLKVTDNAAASVTRAYSLTIAKGTPSFSNLSHPTINAGVTPTAIGGKISLGSLYPSGNVNITINSVSHTAAISASDGSFSYNFVTNGLAAGSYPITYQYAGNSNFNSQIDTGNSLTVNPASLTITTGSPLTPGTVGISYSASFNASGGTAPYIWALNTGSTLPNGITLSGNTISGTPTAAGSYSFIMKVTDSASHAATQSLEITILPVSNEGGAGGSGGGGGGGGGGGAEITTIAVNINDFTQTGKLTLNASGAVQTDVQLKSLDQTAVLSISGGTVLLDALHKPLTTIYAERISDMPFSPPEAAVILAYDFGPDGATFNPSLILTLSYDETDLPPDTEEDSLYMVIWDGTQWVEINSILDPATHTISAEVSHFSMYALLSKLTTSVPTPITDPAPETTTAVEPAPIITPPLENTTAPPSSIIASSPLETRPAPSVSSGSQLTITQSDNPAAVPVPTLTGSESSDPVSEPGQPVSVLIWIYISVFVVVVIATVFVILRRINSQL